MTELSFDKAVVSGGSIVTVQALLLEVASATTIYTFECANFKKSPAFNLPAPSLAKPSIAIVVSATECAPFTNNVPDSFPKAFR